MTLFNYWHYFILAIIFLIFIGGVVASLKQENKKLGLQMLLSITLVSLLLAVTSIFIVDKYTKKVELYKVKNKRLLSTEKIIYTGVVKNEGHYTIGEVVVKIKLVNKGHATGNVKGGNFYKPSGFSGFFDFFTGGGEPSKPQSITKEFVVAKNLKAGTAKSFRVYFDYPPYFRSVADFTTVSGH